MLLGIDLAFASLRWQTFVARRRSEPGTFDRRALEVCVFVHLADALQSGDLYVVGAEIFADYRAQLLPWTECKARVPAYCTALGIPERGEDFWGPARCHDGESRITLRLPSNGRPARHRRGC